MEDRNVTIINNQQILNYHQQILDHALTQAVRRNEEQFEVWINYKAQHKKVIEGLETIPLEVGVNCMVPIGKKALMKGRLVHTNEILVSLGEGYFAKYSAAKAVALCNRRIQLADETLKRFKAERDLYEMRQILPLQYNAFGDSDRSDVIDHWSEQDLDNWRISHREKEREYRQKLSQLKIQEKPKLESEDDLFHRLDELELEEELADELDRLEDKHSHDDEDYSEEDNSSSEELANEVIQEELQKLKEICTTKDPNYATMFLKEDTSEEKKVKEIENIVNESEGDHKPSRRVSFVEPILTKTGTMQQEKKIHKINVGNTGNIDNIKDPSDENEPIVINITHSNANPEVKPTDDGNIETPSDIYKLHLAPKSILKKFANQKLYVTSVEPSNESNTDEEDEAEGIKLSAYQTVVKDIQENKSVAPEKGMLDQSATRPISKFKMERRGVKK